MIEGLALPLWILLAGPRNGRLMLQRFLRSRAPDFSSYWFQSERARRIRVAFVGFGARAKASRARRLSGTLGRKSKRSMIPAIFHLQITGASDTRLRRALLRAGSAQLGKIGGRRGILCS